LYNDTQNHEDFSGCICFGAFMRDAVIGLSRRVGDEMSSCTAEFFATLDGTKEEVRNG
jgi:hypothetical protein